MSLTFDKNGRPLLIIKEQGKKSRIKGLEAQKNFILAARTIADTLRSSLGPKGMDKMIVDGDGEITVTNDGATILSKMHVEHDIARLLVELSRSQDAEMGDGTTGVVVLAGALLAEAEQLLDRSLHPIRVADGFERACEIACEHLTSTADVVEVSRDNLEPLIEIAMVALGSKIVNRDLRHVAEICVQAVMQVADLDRRDVDLDLIKIVCKPGGRMSDTCLVEGVILEKEWAHPGMTKELSNAKMAILTCPFEPPKPKTKHKLNVTSAEEFQALYEREAAYFVEMIDQVKASGANMVICQWGFDDEATHLLTQNNLPAVRWVGGVEMELIALATNGRIVPRFADLDETKLGEAGVVREVALNTTKERMIFIEGCPTSKAVSILVRGSSASVVDEVKRSIHDALCVVRNLIRDNNIIYGGGAAEITCSLAVEEAANQHTGVDQYALHAFSRALDKIPFALAENSGLDPITTLTTLKAQQVETGCSSIGVDCNLTGTNDMKEQCVFDPLKSKVTAFRLAAQLVKQILKIDDVIVSGAYE